MNDTYSRREGNVISLGTDKLAMELTLTPEGRFVQTSLCHRVTGKEYVQCGPVQPDEFSIEVNGERICGNRGGFTLTGVETRHPVPRGGGDDCLPPPCGTGDSPPLYRITLALPLCRASPNTSTKAARI